MREDDVQVTDDNFKEVVHHLCSIKELSLDTETTGLRPHHGDRLFSISISDGREDYYFNFIPYECIQPLTREHLYGLRILFEDHLRVWFMANAKFDLSMLAREGMQITGRIHDILVTDRLIQNDHMSYSLESVAKRYGEEKSGEVEKWIKDNSAWEWVEILGKRQREKKLFYSKVPLGIIQPYAEKDAHITFNIAKRQEEKLREIADGTPATVPNIFRVHSNERNLLKTVFLMEERGVKVDKDYCLRAISFEKQRMDSQLLRFKNASGNDYMASPKLFETVFQSEKASWRYTEKNNPSFESDTLKTFKSDAAKAVLEIRDSKSKLDFYHGFLQHSDSQGLIHPSFNQAGTASGRFSSSNPNFQNLTSEEDEKVQPEFPLRRALVPREGYIFIMPDYSQMEYRLMLDYAADIVGYETPLIKEIKNGKDVHQATADLVLASSGLDIGRSRAKNANFATLYGSGITTLASTLGTTEEDARRVKRAVFQAAPEIQTFIQVVMKAATIRGYIFNWFGRRSYFPDSNFAYKAPNYLIQGGCADIVKVAMNRVHEYLQTTNSRMVMSIHDELVIEVRKDEVDTVPIEVHKIMESVYPSKFLPMVCSMEWSDRSLADKQKGFPK